MGFFDFFRSKNAVEETTNEPVFKAKKANKKVIQQQLYRFNQELSDWKIGVSNWEDPFNPITVDLIRVYNDLVIDSHLSAVMEARISKTLSKDFKICDEDGEEIDEETAIFASAWFRDFLRYSLESKFYGYSLIQFGDRIGKSFKKVENFRREYVHPQKEAVRRSPYDNTDLIPYNKGVYQKWLIGVGKPYEHGLLMKAAPNVIFKKTALGSWTEFAELFGAPLRVGKTNVRDNEVRENMELMLENMGRNAWAVLDTDDMIEFVRDTKTDSHHVFNELVERVNSEISKLILGSTMTTDDGSSRSQSEVHERTTGAINKEDAFFIEDLVNTCLIPWLNEFHGFGITGRWRFDDTEALSKEQQFKIDIELVKNGFNVPKEYFTETYNTPIDEKEEEETPDNDPNTDPDELENSLKKKTTLTSTLESFIDAHSCDLCNELDYEDTPPPEWDEDFIDSIITGVHAGAFTLNNLPESLYLELADRITAGLYEGIASGTSLPTIADPDYIRAMRNNAFVFSGAKTFQQVKEMSDFLLDENGVARSFKEYKEKARQIFGTYNVNWLRTEINHAKGSGQMAEKWQQFEEEADVFPMLRYETAGDERVRASHKALDGVIKPVGSPFWDQNAPLNGWNCRCDLVQVVEEEDETPDNEITVPEDIPDYMKVNPGKQKVIYSPEHPYFIVEDQFTDLRDRNFNLPAPPKVSDKAIKEAVKSVKTKAGKIELEGFKGLHTYGTLKGSKLKKQKELEKVVGYKIPDRLIEFSDENIKHGELSKGNYIHGTKQVNFGKGSKRELDSNVYKYQVLAHELGHAVHHNTGEITYSLRFRGNKAVFDMKRSEKFEDLMKLARKEIKDVGEEGLLRGQNLAVKAIKGKTGKENGDVREIFGNFIDALGDLTKGRLGSGHTKKYYKERNGIEFFAHLSENYFIGNPYFEAALPKTYKAGNEYLKQLFND